jgi:lactaldehyde dehydrogenase/glycolaldehyde dehydrogenase
MKTYESYVNGSFINFGSLPAMDVIDPATEAVYARVSLCGEQEASLAVSAARDSQKAWARLPACERAEYLLKLAALLKTKAGEMGKIISAEQGKPLWHSTGEAGAAAEIIDYHAGWARRIEGEIIPSDDRDENIFIYKEPLGVVACILPWNFPVFVLARKLAPALITGNTVVLKPSSDTPCSALAFARLVDEIGLPAGVVNVVSGKGSVLGRALTQNPQVDMVTLTGSTGAGKRVMAACADSLTKVSLELGGKAPAVVMGDADLDLAVNCIKGGRLGNAGQVCNCVERVYVHQSIAEAFVSRMCQAMSDVQLGPGLEGPEMGPLVNKAAMENVHAMVLNAIEQGATLECGGKPSSKFSKGFFYEPTVLTGCRQEMEIMREEIFGPVMPVMTFETEEEALALANDCKYGLTATLYTRDYGTALRFSNHIEAGELYINRKQGEAFQGYHAGWKQSGLGGDDGRHGVESFLKTRTVYMQY